MFKNYCTAGFFLLTSICIFQAYNAMHIVAITGSLRKASCNTGVLRAMQKALPAGHTMDIIVPNLPLFNQDLERPDLYPTEVKEFRNRLKAADCFLFSLSEYNYGISGKWMTVQ
jgi:chromate reductase